MKSDKPEITLKTGKQFNYEYIKNNRVIKIYQDNSKIIIAKDRTLAKAIQNEIEYLFIDYTVIFEEVSIDDFDELLRSIISKPTGENMPSKNADSFQKREDLAKLASDAPVVNFVNEIIIEAIKQNASDIHFEVFEKGFRIRFRTNGFLYEFGSYSIDLYPAICARIKVFSGLDITQKRLSQDGKALLQISGRKLDIRTSTMPTIYGESIVLRLLASNKSFTTLDEIGIDEQSILALHSIAKLSYGVFLLTGPTGSGKTTTLKAMLNLIDKTSKNIITIEDPVEYTIHGINQVQINDKIGFGFETILRNVLRQDPDIIMIGEMRDRVTADLALRSAMTGHLVFSTLHTNDAVSTISRLINMGIERYIIESSILAIAAQRLVRVLCDHCKEEVPVTGSDKVLFSKFDIDITKSYKPVGCPRCGHTGFNGRTAVLELFTIDETIREHIIAGASLSAITRHLKEIGFKTIFEKGLIGVKEGRFYLDEIKSIVRDSLINGVERVPV